MKPTYGRVSRHGVVPLSWSLDHVGPMARSVEDYAILLQAIAGYDPKDAASANVPVPDLRSQLKNGIKGLRVGVPRVNWFNENKGTDPETEAIFDNALKTLESLGAVVAEINGRPFGVARKANQTILTAEAYAFHEKRFSRSAGKIRQLRSQTYAGRRVFERGRLHHSSASSDRAERTNPRKLFCS